MAADFWWGSHGHLMVIYQQVVGRIRFHLGAYRFWVEVGEHHPWLSSSTYPLLRVFLMLLCALSRGSYLCLVCGVQVGGAGRMCLLHSIPPYDFYRSSLSLKSFSDLFEFPSCSATVQLRAQSRTGTPLTCAHELY